MKFHQEFLLHYVRRNLRFLRKKSNLWLKISSYIISMIFAWIDRLPPGYIIHLHKTRDDPFLTWGHQDILKILHSKSIGVIIFYVKIGKSFQINWKENWKKNMETSEVDIWHSKKFLEQHMFQR